eukprot:GEMP01046917.1.p1 GENE.GEMP01046917.1~~GEMP01046917.1.p1  ORF type:complete len:217 (+),score=34.26 GEMP01046917.1:147-797(+)
MSVVGRGFHGDSLVQVCQNNGCHSVRIRDLETGDVVSTGCRKVPTAEVKKVLSLTGAANLVTVRPGLSLVSTHPVKTKGGPEEGRWQYAEQLENAHAAITEKQHGTYYNVELAGHVDTMLVSGMICSVLGTYCGPRIGWDEYTRKTTRCDYNECKDQGDEFYLRKRRCVICDMVCRNNASDATRGYVAVPRAFREARGHACYGEPLVTSFDPISRL